METTVPQKKALRISSESTTVSEDSDADDENKLVIDEGEESNLVVRKRNRIHKDKTSGKNWVGNDTLQKRGSWQW